MAIDRRHPREIRADIRSGKLTSVTAGLGEGHVQATLAVLPKDYAYDFLLFCQRNPRACPLIEVTEVGSPEPTGVAPERICEPTCHDIGFTRTACSRTRSPTPRRTGATTSSPFCSAARSRSSGPCWRPASISGT